MKRYSTILKNSEVRDIAIGGFDGIHIAHQKLISNLSSYGALVVIDKDSATLTPNRYRCNYLNHDCIFLPFDDIKELKAKEFIDLLKREFVNLKKIVVGYDFRFGKDAHASVDDLKRIFNGEVVVVDEVIFDGISVHSRVIKRFLKEGNIKKANMLLGRNYQIVGTQIKGQGVGSKELYATINLDVKNFLIPKDGVYATFTEIGDKSYKSATFIGKRVSTDGEYSIETHILDNIVDSVDGSVTISFVDFIRENREFDNLGLLKRQISKDLIEIKNILR